MSSHKLSTLLRTLILLAVIAAGLAVSLDRALADSVCGSDPTQVGCWLFDEGTGTTTADGSGNGNTGTLVVGTGGSMWVADRFGNAGKALHFDGATQHVQVAGFNSLDITGDITIAAWVKPEQILTQDVVKKAVTTGTYIGGYELALSSGSGNCAVSGGTVPCAFARFNATASAPDTYRVDTKLPTYSATDPWTLYVVTYTGVDTTLRIYKNGTLSNSRVVSPLTIASNSLFLGFGAQLAGTTSPPTASRWFKGSLDDIRLYKRALSAAEIKVLYNDSAPAGFTCTSLQSQAGTASTVEKPQSKVWSYDGKWWSVFPASSGVSSAGAWLWRLDSTTWTPVLKLSTNASVRADVKPAGSPVGSVVHILLYNGSSADLASVQYSAGTYQAWTSRPGLTSLPLSGSETATIDIDSTGRMWLATQRDVGSNREIIVYDSASPYTSWNGPQTLATVSNNQDDISVITALPNNTVGVLWSNQTTKRFGFKYHRDVDPAATWSADEVPASQSAQNVGAGMADDHLNVAVASDGTLYAAVKTSYDTAGYPKIAMLVRRPSGTSGAGVWDTNIYGVSETGTRAIVLLDEIAGVVTVIYSSAEGGGNILYRQTAIQPIAFGAVQTMRSGTNNDASSTKQNINAEMVTIYSNGTTVNGSLCTATPSGGVDLSITKTDNKTVALPGDASTYTIVVANTSASPVSGVTVADTFPTTLTGVTWTCSAGSGSSCTPSGSSNINDTITLAAGGSVTYLASATIASSATGAVQNTATVTPPAGVSDPNSANNTATDGTALRTGGGLCGSDPNLVACYQLDEGAGNVFLDGVQNTVYNDGLTADAPSWVTGKVGQALNFNGTTQYGYIPDEASLDVTTAVTLAAWIRPSGTAAATQRVIAKTNMGSTDGYELSLSSGGKVFVRFNQVTSGDTYRINSTTSYPLNNTAWMHVAATYGGGYIRLYINGVQEGSSLAMVGPIAANTLDLGIGTEPPGATTPYRFQGALDDVRIYKRALSASEIQALVGVNQPPAQPTLIAPTNGGTGVPTAPDLTVNVTDPENESLTVTFYGRAKGTTGENFTLAVLPDTQYYTSRTTATSLSACSTYASIFNAQTQWIVDHRTTNNIAFVSHLGDMTDAGNNDTDDSEWTVGDAAMKKLEAVNPPAGGIPYGFAPGNHDLTGGTAQYKKWFGPTRFAGRSYYGGSYDTDNRNSYDVFSTNNMNFIVLNIDCSATPIADVLNNWADPLLKADVNRRGIVVCHDLLNTSAPVGFSSPGAAVYDALRDNPNLFLMLGGHLDTEGQVTGSNTANGGPIYALRSDYQSRTPAGGNSWMRLMEFQPANNLIQVKTYAPCLDQYETDASSEFTLSYNMVGAGAYAQIGTPQSVSSGSTAIVNWPSLAQGTEYEWYVTVSDGHTTVTGPTWAFTTGTGGNNPPIVTQPSNQTSTEGQAINLQIAASDQDLDPLNYIAAGLPAGLTIGAGTGLIAGTISAGAASSSPYSASVTVTDGKGGSDTKNFTWTVQVAPPSACGSDPSLVGCWPMNEGSGTTAIDGGALPANNVTFAGDPTWVAGQSGSAISLNGSSQYGTAADEASLDIANQITLAAWVKPGKYDTQDLIKKATNGSVDGYELSLATTKTDDSSQRAFFRINQVASGDTYRINATTMYPIDGTWMHVAATFDGTTMRLYINGVQESLLSTPPGLTIATNTVPLSIGAQSNNLRWFQGALDQVRVYNRALSADEVAGLVGGSLPPTGLTCTDILPKTATISTEWKPQSKVWRYAGAWWSVFPTAAGADGASSAGTWLWKLVGNQWTEVLKLSTRTDTKADVKVAGNVIHALLYNDPNTQLASAQYNAGTGFYEAWSQRPGLSSINLPNSEVATIDIDSTGRMWLATRDESIPGNARIVAYYSDSPYSNWTNPPIEIGTGVVAGDDISVVTALPGATGKIGILWSNQNTKRFGFKTHVDGAAAGNWSVDEVPASQSAINGVGAGMADDHMNVAVASDGTLYAAVKTGYDTASYPKIALLVRRPSGTWDNLYGLDEAGTRPIALLDEANGVLTVIYTESEGYNRIVYRQSALNPIAFDGKKTLQGSSYNDVSSSKGNYTAELVTIFANATVVAGEICGPTGARPQPPVPAIGTSGVNNVNVHFTWPKVTLDTTPAATTVLRYQVYRSLLPYFEPGDQSSPLPLNQPTGLTYDDLGVVPSTTAYYYVLRAVNAVGPSADSKRTGKFTFTLTPGSQ